MIRVAITGGGVAGASLLRVLSQFPHLDVHVFESAPAFREAGLAIGLGENALSAIDLMGPRVADCLKRAGAVPTDCVHFMLGTGPDRGAEVGELSAQRKRRGLVVHRAVLLHELLADAAEERLHPSKQLVRIVPDSGESPVTLHFGDGTTHECDVLIGADGIRSFVRKYVLGPNDPAANPEFTGWWMVQTVRPFAEMQNILGSEYVDKNRAGEFSWLGDGAFLMHNLVNDGTLVQLIVAIWSGKAGEKGAWTKQVSAEDIRTPFESWVPSLRRAVQETLCAEPTQTAFCLWDHPSARSYVKGSVVLTGDAAHATTPWQASGAAMSMEDSLILSSLLGRATSPNDAQTALQVYDRMRRPRTQEIVSSSRGTGLIMTGQSPDIGLELESLRANLLPRWNFIADFDVQKHLDDAVALFEARQPNGE